jgi:F0F1-type ATP synthase membrane subunit c/vacuolar-type H+-ATPase subunit K
MGRLVATVVDTQALLETVLASLVAGVGVAIVFSVAIYGSARFSEMGREGRTASALAFGLVAALGMLAFAALIVVGIFEMTQK